MSGNPIRKRIIGSGPGRAQGALFPRPAEVIAVYKRGEAEFGLSGVGPGRQYYQTNQGATSAEKQSVRSRWLASQGLGRGADSYVKRRAMDFFLKKARGSRNESVREAYEDLANDLTW